MATIDGYTPKATLHTRYTVDLQFRGELWGGIPKDPKVVEGWLRGGKLRLHDEDEYRRITIRHLQELGHEISADLSGEELDEALERLAGEKSTQGFHANRTDGRLYIESRYVNSALREAANILYAGDRWGPTKKSPKAFFVEHVSVPDERIYLLSEAGEPVTAPDDVRTWIGHVPDRRGGVTGTLGYHEVLVRPKASFALLVLEDDARGGKELTPERWYAIWSEAEEMGLGAKRSQNFGKFEATMRQDPGKGKVPAGVS